MSNTSDLQLFSTCELSDALIKLGLDHGGHIPDVYAMNDVGGSAKTLCGPAYTVQMVLTSDTEAPKLKDHFVDAAVSGSVMVIDVPPRWSS